MWQWTSSRDSGAIAQSDRKSTSAAAVSASAASAIGVSTSQNGRWITAVWPGSTGRR